MPGLYKIYDDRYGDCFNLLIDTYIKKYVEKIKRFFKDLTIWIKIRGACQCGFY